MTRTDLACIAANPAGVTPDDVRRMATDYLALLERLDGEAAAHAEAIRVGIEDARERGAHIGRPMVEIDLQVVADLWAAGYGLRGIARKTGHSRSTIRRRLDDLGLT